MDFAIAVSLGPFIQAAYDQFRNQPSQTNPTQIPGLPEGYELVRNIQMTDFIVAPLGVPQLYGYLARGGQPEQQVVALRGTADILEWWDNIHFLPVSFSNTVKNGGNVAQGFYDIYRTLTTTDPQQQAGVAANQLVEAIDPDIPLVVTGHSLGAALATLLVADLAANTALEPQAWTFASPKVGDSGFAATYGLHSTVSWRIYNILDVIPQVPVDPFDDFQHVNAGYPIDSTGLARRSVACFHDLNTYLHVLSDGNVAINLGCRP